MNPGLQYEIDRVKPQRSTEWLQGPRISFDDVNHGSGRIERVTADEWFGRIGKNIGNPAAGQSPKVAQPPTVVHVMRFGKYRDRPMSEVQSMDPGYWAWLIREVDGFEAKARKAGLLDDAD